MLGIDISNWQAGFDIANSGVDFCIVKATEGVGFVDKTCDAFVQQCINNNIPFGYYHFNRTNNANKEAEFFASKTKGYVGKGIPVLDYETPNKNDKAWVESFINRYHELTGIWCMIYISASWCHKFTNSWVAEKCGLWVAGYPKKYTTYPVTKMPYNIAPWKFAAIWQFTDCLKIGGYSVDGDIAYMDVAAWNKYAGKDSTSVTTEPKHMKKDTETIAWEVIGGKWSCGEERKKMLTDAGYDYETIQSKVNELMNRKTIDQLAHEVINGKWGNGIIRKNALTRSGYDYDAVQKRVNELINNN